MITPELIEYVKAHRAKKISDDEITKILIDAEWQLEDIKEALLQDLTLSQDSITHKTDIKEIKRSKGLFLSIIVITTVVLGGGAVFGYFYLSNGMSDALVTENAEKDDLSAKTISEDYECSQRYTNERLLIEFCTTPDYIIVENNSDNQLGLFNKSSYEIFGEDALRELFGVIHVVFTPITETSFEEIIQGYDGMLSEFIQDINTVQSKINGITATQLSGTLNESSFPVGSMGLAILGLANFNKVYFVKKEDGTLIIIDNTGMDNTHSEARVLFESTFRILDNSDMDQPITEDPKEEPVIVNFEYPKDFILKSSEIPSGLKPIALAGSYKEDAREIGLSSNPGYITNRDFFSAVYDNANHLVMEEIFASIYENPSNPNNEMGVFVIRYKTEADLKAEFHKLKSQKHTEYLKTENILVIVWADTIQLLDEKEQVENKVIT